MEVILDTLAASLPPSLLSALAVYVAVRVELRGLIERLGKAENHLARIDERTKGCVVRRPPVV